MNDPKGPDMADRSPLARGQTRADRSATAQGCDLRILGQRFDATGQEVRFAWQGTPYQVRLDLIGGFQAENVALAAGLAIAAGDDPAAVLGDAAAADRRARPHATGRHPRRTAPRSLSITPIPPMPSQPRSRRCARM